MSAKDYYKILGVDEKAGDAEIKKAYRRLAKQCHPDANPGDKQAEERFKEISEAYEVLGDKAKRQKYDQMRKMGIGGEGFNFQGFDFGNYDFSGFRTSKGRRPGRGGFSQQGFDIFGGLGDIFAQFFDMGERTRQRQTGPRRGDDIGVRVSVSFEVSVSGGKTSFAVEKETTCPVCHGGGAKPGSQVQACPECGGLGHITIGQGGFGVSRPCPKCFGRGQIITNPCDRCHGSGHTKGRRTYTVKIPAGTEDGKQIRLKGQGQPGVAGGPPGDMIVTVRVQPHRFFSRCGSDIRCEVTLNLAQAVHGATLRVRSVDGKKIQVKVPPGTQDGTALRLKGMGIAKNGRRRGDQYVTVRVKKPAHPTKEEEALLEQLDQMKRA